MAIDKPTKPTDLMPEGFALDGVKNNFSSSKIATGFSANFDDILQGDNLNYMLDSIGKQLNYLNTIADFINGMSIGKTITVNANNKLDYISSTDSNKANIDLDNLSTIGQAKLDDKANKTEVQAAIEAVIPVGTIIQYAMPNTPLGYLKCNGSAISRSTYENLFNVIGTTYGSGDGSTTFNVPNYSSVKIPTSSTAAVVGDGNGFRLTNGSVNGILSGVFRERGDNGSLYLSNIYAAGDVRVPQLGEGSSGMVANFTYITTNYYIKY